MKRAKLSPWPGFTTISQDGECATVKCMNCCTEIDIDACDAGPVDAQLEHVCKRRSFYVIDGHSQMYRALFSQGPRLTSPDGKEPTNGTYIFTRMLLKLARERKPDYLVMTLDGPRSELHRRDIYPPYKMNRNATPDPSIFVQIDRMISIIKALGIPIVTHKKWEADDVVASLVNQFGRGKKTFIVTRDKDFHQLVEEHIVCYDPQSEEIITRQDVLNRWGINDPRKVLEIQILMGDSTDNVPGVPGIGLATATKIINKWGSASNAKHAARTLSTAFKPALRDALKSADLEMCRELVQLNSALVLAITEQQMRFRGLDIEAATPIFDELGFKRFAQLNDPPAKAGGFYGRP